MKQKVTKAIIPAAGLGTRFLPVTKSIPKEMLAIVDVPAIQYIVQEVVDAGIKDILIIVSSNKNALVDYFDSNFILETELTNKNKTKQLEIINNISNMANIQYVRQKYPKGLGDAIMHAKSFINDEPFAVILGDDVIINKDKNKISGLKQCIDVYEKHHKMVLGVQKVSNDEVSKYGIVSLKNKSDINKSSFEVNTIIEKPKLNDAPSNFAVIGRYILTPEIFDILKETKVSDRGEIELTPALEQIIKDNGAYACDIDGKRYDIGSKIGFIQATIDEALSHNEIKEEVINYIKEISVKI